MKITVTKYRTFVKAFEAGTYKGQRFGQAFLNQFEEVCPHHTPPVGQHLCVFNESDRKKAVAWIEANGVDWSQSTDMLTGEAVVSDQEKTSINPTLAIFQSGVAGYGHRLFIPASTVFWPCGFDSETLQKSETAHDLLESLSCWGGSDVRWIIDGVVHDGYEFAKRGWEGILTRLADASFTFKTFSAGMKIS